MKTCESCGALPEDYCYDCLKDLCPACMLKGCCGNVPARSGELFDYGEQVFRGADLTDANLTERSDDLIRDHVWPTPRSAPVRSVGRKERP